MTNNQYTPSILCAEDDVDDRFFLSETFSDCGSPAQLIYVSNGEEALLYLQNAARNSRLPALVVLDLNMPRQDGKQTLRAIKNDPQLQDLPVMILSTSQSRIDKEFCKAQGAVSYLQKPSSFSGYQQIIRSFLPYITP